MAVIVKLFGNIRILLNRAEIKLDWKGGSLREMIEQMAVDHDKTIREELLDDNGELDRAYVVFIRGVRIDDLSRRIEDGNEVVINSILAGG